MAPAPSQCPKEAGTDNLRAYTRGVWGGQWLLPGQVSNLKQMYHDDRSEVSHSLHKSSRWSIGEVSKHAERRIP